ncbi:hypothetical protein K438DRAFT_1789695 [Mycena galopus ATCC 62051]|nr:hypothetical protein K438DRAFT_1789695 [Mycena galopus ATCC 62051]
MLPLGLSVCIVLAGAISLSHAVEYRMTRHTSQYSTLESPPLRRASFSSPIVSRTSRRASKTHALHSLRASGSNSGPVQLVGANHDFEYLSGATAFETVSISGLTGNFWVYHFSIALNRGTAEKVNSPAVDPHLGYLAFGGIAPVPVVASTQTTVPIQGYSLATRAPTTSRHPTYFYYTADVVYNTSGIATSSNTTIIDSGTTLNLVPSDIARAYNKGWATWRAGSYYVDCSATAPPFAVTIGGTTSTSTRRTRWCGWV